MQTGVDPSKINNHQSIIINEILNHTVIKSHCPRPFRFKLALMGVAPANVPAIAFLMPLANSLPVGDRALDADGRTIRRGKLHEVRRTRVTSVAEGYQVIERIRAPCDAALVIGNLLGHPHVGGEIPPKRPCKARFGGPSPRGWGNLKRRFFVSRKSLGHPHVGGEILNDVQRFAPCSGPSPRGWGNRGAKGISELSERAIPTWVGKSNQDDEGETDEAGHPHVGGEISASANELRQSQ